MNFNIDVSFIVVLCIAVLFAAIIAYLVLLLRKTRERETLAKTRYRDLELRVNSLQLETLEAKLNPHLFKNVRQHGV